MLGQLDTFIAFAVVLLGISLLITVLNHIATALVGLRGRNLRWGIETLLQQVDPKLSVDARRITEEILQHPLISDSTMSKTHSWPLIGGLLGHWRKGSAIRVGELVHILRKLAEPIPPGQKPSHWRQTLTLTLAEHDKQAADRLQAATDLLQTLRPEAIEKIDNLAPQIAAQVRRAVGDIELWFDSVMDRVSQRYAARVRVFTVVFAVLLAFSLHLDVSVLLQQIRSDPELRARLVASADAISQQAQAVLGTTVSAAYRIAAQRLQPEADELKKAGDVPALVSEADGEAWLALHVPDLERRRQLIERYNALVQEELKKRIGQLGENASAIKETLQTTGLQLIPDYSRHRRQSDQYPDWWPFGASEENRRHFLGVLASAALLSLGAPFWFHALKTAASLKPVAATKEREDRAQRT